MLPSQNILLACLDPTTDCRFFAELHDFSADRYKVLQEQREIIDYIYFPATGMVSLVNVMEDGSTVETGAIGFDGATGINSALSGNGAPTRGIVQLPLRAKRISASAFRRSYAESKGVRDLVQRQNQLMEEQTHQLAACNALHQIEPRLARWLLRSADYARSNDLRLTQEFIAEMLGVRRTSVTVIACELQKRGLIRYRRGHVLITDREGLERLACECYRAGAAARENILGRAGRGVRAN